jgi:hypothetical protein
MSIPLVSELSLSARIKNTLPVWEPQMMAFSTFGQSIKGQELPNCTQVTSAQALLNK